MLCGSCWSVLSVVTCVFYECCVGVVGLYCLLKLVFSMNAVWELLVCTVCCNLHFSMNVVWELLVCTVY